jgi:fibronectin-binding autotransporter adhesin
MFSGEIKHYKKIVALAIIFAVFISLFSPLSTIVPSLSVPVALAAINKEINYQGKLTNNSGVAVPDGNYNIEFKLYTTPTGGSAVWTEDDLVINGQGASLASGLFSIMLGSTTPFTGVNFNQTLYLGVNIGGTTSTLTPTYDGEMTPRKIIGAVPAAFVADTLQGYNSAEFIRSDAANSTSSASTYLSITNSGAGDIADFFGSSSVNALIVKSTGNVGIGTSSPFSLLSVAGSAYFGGNLTATGTLTIGSLNGNLQAINGVVSATSTLSAAFGGTGSTTPLGGILIGNGNSAINSLTVGSGLSLSGTTLTAVGGSVGAGTQGQFPFYNGSGTALTATSSIFVAQNGFVGVGTTSPSLLFSVAGPAYIAGTLLSGTIVGNSTIDAAQGFNNNGSFFGMVTSNGNYLIGANTRATTTADTGTGDIFEGSGSGSTNTTGGNDIFLGTASGLDNTTGSSNYFAGAESGYSNTTGSNNIAIGTFAMSAPGGTPGAYANNTVVGYEAGYNGVGSPFSSNSLFGYESGFGLTTGSNDLMLGSSAGTTTTTGSNDILIGSVLARSATDSNFLNIGNSIYGNLTTGSVGIGSSTPATTLSVGGSGYLTGGLGIGVLNTTAGTLQTSGNATIGGTLSIGSLNGNLQAINGLLSATSTLSVAYGGTGLSTSPSYGNILVGNSTGGYALTATSSLGLLGSTTAASTYVPYTGATSNVNLGTHGITSMVDNTFGVVGTQYSILGDSGSYGAGYFYSSSGNVLIGGLSYVMAITGNESVAGNLVDTGTTTISSRLGIGTTSPFTTLSVGGSAYIGGNLTATGTLSIGSLFDVHGDGSISTGSGFSVNSSGQIQDLNGGNTFGGITNQGSYYVNGGYNQIIGYDGSLDYLNGAQLTDSSSNLYLENNFINHITGYTILDSSGQLYWPLNGQVFDDTSGNLYDENTGSIWRDSSGNITGNSFVLAPSTVGGLVTGYAPDGGGTPIANFGINMTQLGSPNSSYNGGMFRLDSRGGTYPFFQVIYQTQGDTNVNDQVVPLAIQNTNGAAYTTMPAVFIGWPTNGGTNTGSGNGENLQVYQSEYIGKTLTIASSTPSKNFGLNIATTTLMSGALTDTAAATSTFSQGLNLKAGCLAYNGTCITPGSGTVNSGTAGQLAFYNASGTTLSATSTIFISQTGNFGIGSTSPNHQLTIAGTANGGNAWIESNANNAGLVLNNTQSGGRQFEFDSAGGSATLASTFYLNDDTSSKVTLAVNSSDDLGLGGNITANTLTGDDLTLLHGGNVGIGTTSPFTTLSVGGSAYIGGNLTATGTLSIGTLNGSLQAINGLLSATSTLSVAYGGTGSTTPLGGILIGNGNAGINSVTVGTGLTLTGTTLTASASGTVGSGTTGQFPFYNGSGTALTATSSIFLSVNGSVGIGSTTPGAILSVNGFNSIASGASAPDAFDVIGGTGATGSGTAGGLGGAITLVSGTGGVHGTSGFAGGAGGPISIIAGIGGVGSGSSNGGLGGNIQLIGGVGGGATLGSSLDGNGGTVYLAGGQPGTGAASSGKAGNVVLGMTPAGVSQGNVGVGTTSPYSLLSVAGQVVAQNFVATSTIIASIFPYASTTALTVSGTNGLTLASLTGILQGINGTVSASSTLSVAYGGTGLSTSPSYGNILVGNSTGGYALTATSSLGLLGSTTAASTYVPYTGATNGVNIGAHSFTSTTDGYFGSSQYAILGDSGSYGAGYFSGSGGSVTLGGLTALGVTGTSVLAGNTSISSGTLTIGSLNGNLQAIGGVVSATSTLSVAYGGTGSTTPLGGILIGNGNAGINSVTVGSGLSLSGTTLSATAVGTVGSGTAGQFPFYNGSGTTLTATSSLFLAQSGNVGIGTTSPYAKLSVAGSIVAANYIATSSATSTFVGSVTAGNGSAGIGLYPSTAGLISSLFLNAASSSQQADVLLNNNNGTPGFSFGYYQAGNEFFLSDNVANQFLTVNRATGDTQFGPSGATLTTSDGNILDDGGGNMTVNGTLNLPSTGTITSGGSESLSLLGTNGLYLSGGASSITTAGGNVLDDGSGNASFASGAVTLGYSSNFAVASFGSAATFNNGFTSNSNQIMDSSGQLYYPNGSNLLTDTSNNLYTTSYLFFNNTAGTDQINSDTGDMTMQAIYNAEITAGGSYLDVSSAGVSSSLGTGIVTSSSGALGTAGITSLLAAGTGLSYSGSTLNSVWTLASNSIHNNNTLAVGIGTTTPSANFGFDVGTTTLMSGVITNTSTATSTFAGGISLTGGCVSVGGTCLGTGSGTVPSGTAGQFPYYAGSGTTLTATSSIFLATSRNVGIGTTNPLSKLDVSGGEAIGSYAGANAAPANSLTVSGDIGIGTPSPSYKLQVVGDNSSGSTPQLVITGSTNPNYATLLGFTTAGSGDGYVQAFSNASTLTATTFLINPNGGNVAIAYNTGSPASPLVIGGGVSIGASYDGVTAPSSGMIVQGTTGIGTSTPGSILSIGGVANFTTATSTFYGNGINISNGCFAVNGTCVGGSSSGSTFGYPFALTGNATSTLTQFNGGLTAYASSTIGTGSGTGLTVSGSQTTTLNQYIGGEIGIATTPISNTRMVINGNATIASGILLNGQGLFGSGPTDNTNGVGLYLAYNSSGNRQFVIGDSSALGSSVNGFFRYNTGTPLPSIDGLTGSGNTRLDVNIGENSTGGNSMVGIGFEYSGVTGTDLPANFLTVNGNESIGQSYRTTAAPTNGLLVQGNVGIGTTSPYSMLSVAGLIVGQNYVATSTTATSTFAGTVSIGSITPAANALFEIGTSSPLIYFDKTSGLIGIGTTSPQRPLDITNSSSNAQLRISQSSVNYAELTVNATGDLLIAPTGTNVRINNGNLFVCTGGACNAGSPVGQGNIIANTAIGIGSSTPFAALSIGANGAILTTEKAVSYASTMTINWLQGNQQVVTLTGTGNTVAFSNQTAGATLRLILCQDSSGSRTVTSWDSSILWSGGVAPTLTTTPNKCDVFTFLATNGTSTLRVLGSSVQNF